MHIFFPLLKCVKLFLNTHIVYFFIMEDDLIVAFKDQCVYRKSFICKQRHYENRIEV